MILIVINGIRAKNTSSNIKNCHSFPTITFIIPVKDEEGNLLDRALSSIQELNYKKEKIEIVVVDGSTKESLRKAIFDVCKKSGQNIKLVRQSNSNGKPAALNIGLRYARGEIVGVLDVDTVLSPNVLIGIANLLEDKNLVAVQGRTTSINREENLLTSIAALEEDAWFRLFIQGKNSMNLFIPLTGSCTFIRKKILEEIGGWSLSLAEDVELAVRLTKKQYKIKYADNVIAWHETPSSIREFLKQRKRWFRGYIEESFKNLSNGLLNRLGIDIKLTLAGPLFMSICFLSYITWILTLFFESSSTLTNFVFLIYTPLTLGAFSLIGLTIAFGLKPFKLKNIVYALLVPAYWFLLNLCAIWSALSIILRRKRIWEKTKKRGIITEKVLQYEEELKKD